MIGTTYSCSFCGKSQDEVRKLIAGATVYICDECIDLCNDIIAEEVPPRRRIRQVHQPVDGDDHVRAADSSLTMVTTGSFDDDRDGIDDIDYDIPLKYLGNEGALVESTEGNEDEIDTTTKGCVYFLSAPGLNRVKVGWSSKPFSRVQRDQTMSPVRLQLVALLGGTRSLEKSVQRMLLEHGRWCNDAGGKEWFKLSDVEAAAVVLSHLGHGRGIVG